ncbi:MAG: FdhD protein [Polaribacter sp.]|jgi:FdhD protein
MKQTQINRYKVKQDIKTAENDIVVVEEPLQIDLCQDDFRETYSITMRTPGDDQYLTYGLLFSEGIIDEAKNIDSMTGSVVDEVVTANLIKVEVAPTYKLHLENKSRRLASYSGCGICGKTSLQALSLKNPRKPRNLHFNLSCYDIKKARQILAKQTLFSDTGGAHVAGIVYEVFKNDEFHFDFDSAHCFEDVGRHNALDKLIGYELTNNNLSHSAIVILSGRVGFELVQKVVMAGFSTIVALGAPSDLAIKTANQFSLTLIGFAKDEQYNIYTF